MKIIDYLQKFILKRFFPFKEWISDLRNPKNLQADIVAGQCVSSSGSSCGVDKLGIVSAARTISGW